MFKTQIHITEFLLECTKIQKLLTLIFKISGFHSSTLGEAELTTVVRATLTSDCSKIINQQLNPL